jgi:hypothetical protein
MKRDRKDDYLQVGTGDVLSGAFVLIPTSTRFHRSNQLSRPASTWPSFSILSSDAQMVAHRA